MLSVQKNQVCWQGIITCPCATITPKQGETKGTGHEDNAPAP